MTSAPRPAQRKILVTHALPYANGALHIGHMLGYIQCDIWVRAQRMRGADVYFVAADDVHGTPIMLAAEKVGMTPELFIRDIQISHEADFKAFGVDHDFYYTTHSTENRELAELVYTRLRDARPDSHIARRSIRQLFDPVKQMFLPDRYVKGICPNCGTPDQYGDNCENCGATYAPTDLIDPRSVMSGATPQLRESEHYFFKVGDFTEWLREWFAGKLTNGHPVVHLSVQAKLAEWLNAEGGVRDWDISRDAPYFGFPIPDAPGKFFYVWLDAPIGYLASFKKYCASDQGAARGLTAATFDSFMQRNDPGYDAGAEMHHFIGKDIVNFHGLFWPAMLQGAQLRTPTALHVNGYLTVNGEKMSKSRGTFIEARTYLQAGLPAEYLRYYFATVLGTAPTDVDLDLKAFVDVVNSHIVGKFVNIASRSAKLLETHFDNVLGADFWTKPDAASAAEIAGVAQLNGTESRLAKVVALYDSGEFGRAIVEIMAAADGANAYIAGAAPWALAKHPDRRADLHVVLTTSLNLFRLLACALRPVLPEAATWAAEFLGLDATTAFTFPQGLLKCARIAQHQVNPYAALYTRVDATQVAAMIESSRESLAQPMTSVAAATATPAKGADPSGSTPALTLAADKAGLNTTSAGTALVGIDDFARLDLRIGRVMQCELVEGSDKLLRFELDAGDVGTRQIFSGIRAAYAEPAKLIGRNVVFIANLAPRKMRFGISQGMILSAGSGDSNLFLLDVDQGAQPGMPVK